MSKDSTSNKPTQVFRLRGVSASIFANTAKSDTGERVFHKVSLQRTYKDGDEFKTTSTLGRDELPVAELLLKKAWVYILEAERAKNSEDSE